MAIRSTEFKVGLVVLLAIGLLGWGIIWIKGYRYGREVTQYQAHFGNVGALSVGDPVAVSGVTKGKVVHLALSEGRVLVSFELDKSIPLREDATFTVKNIGLMGERYIEIYPGRSDRPFVASVPAEGRYDTGIPEVMGMMGEMIGEVRALVQTMSTSIQNAPATVSQADSTVVDLRKSARLLAEFLHDNRQRMQNTVEDMEASAETFRATMDKNAQRVDSTLGRAAQASERILVAASKFDSLSQQLKTLAGQVERGEGTLGALMQDPSLYDDLKRTAAEIDALVADIRANPKKYVNVSFKLF